MKKIMNLFKRYRKQILIGLVIGVATTVYKPQLLALKEKYLPSSK